MAAFNTFSVLKPLMKDTYSKKIKAPKAIKIKKPKSGSPGGK